MLNCSIRCTDKHAPKEKTSFGFVQSIRKRFTNKNNNETKTFLVIWDSSTRVSM